MEVQETAGAGHCRRRCDRRPDRLSAPAWMTSEARSRHERNTGGAGGRIAVRGSNATGKAVTRTVGSLAAGRRPVPGLRNRARARPGFPSRTRGSSSASGHSLAYRGHRVRRADRARSPDVGTGSHERVFSFALAE